MFTAHSFILCSMYILSLMLLVTKGIKRVFIITNDE